MRYMIILFFFTSTIFVNEANTVVVKQLSVKEKKKRFIKLVLPPIEKVYNELQTQYEEILEDMKYSRNLYKKEMLKEEYKVQSDEELLMALKPHPKSIALAQAAIESAWATSRFFKEANNVFGMWSSNKNKPRIAALKKRGNKTIWLKKFDSLEDSIRAYYKLLATSKAYKEFRELKIISDDVYLLEEKLHNYSELGYEYSIRLQSVTRYNNFTKYD